MVTSQGNNANDTQSTVIKMQNYKMLLQLVERADKLGFKVEYTQGFELVPVTDSAKAMLTVEKMRDIDSLNLLSIVLNAFELTQGEK